jgi:hypothetical protein
VIREDRFVLSHRPYAVNLGTLATSAMYDTCTIEAVWFRRKSGVTAACVGILRTLLRPAPVTAVEFLERHDDGRHGGDCEGRWDGERYWGAQAPALIDNHLALLRPMLANYPEIPDGYDGWWTFRNGGPV